MKPSIIAKTIVPAGNHQRKELRSSEEQRNFSVGGAFGGVSDLEVEFDIGVGAVESGSEIVEGYAVGGG